MHKAGRVGSKLVMNLINIPEFFSKLIRKKWKSALNNNNKNFVFD